MKPVYCCDCGDELIEEQKDDEDRKIRCPECWSKKQGEKEDGRKNKR